MGSFYYMNHKMNLCPFLFSTQTIAANANRLALCQVEENSNQVVSDVSP
jgi:hypothetical protein